MSSKLKANNKADDTQVTWADQQKINKFGRNHTRIMDLNDELEAKRQEIENMKDSEAEIDNLFEDTGCCMIKIGEVFVDVSNDQAKEHIGRIREQKKTEFGALLKEKVR